MNRELDGKNRGEVNFDQPVHGKGFRHSEDDGRQNCEEYDSSPVTAATLEKLTHIDYRTLKRRIQDLKPVRLDAKSKYYAPWEALPLIYQLDEKKAGDLDLNQERAQLAKVQARKTELEVKKLEKTLIDASEVEREWGQIVVAIRQKLLNFPSRYTPTLTGINDSSIMERNLRDAIYEVLMELSKTYDDQNDCSEHNKEVSTTPDPDGE